MTKDEVVGWHHCLNGHECEQTPGDGEGHGSLVCCSPWGSQRLGYDLVTEQLYACMYTGNQNQNIIYTKYEKLI